MRFSGGQALSSVKSVNTKSPGTLFSLFLLCSDSAMDRGKGFVNISLENVEENTGESDVKLLECNITFSGLVGTDAALFLA